MHARRRPARPARDRALRVEPRRQELGVRLLVGGVERDRDASLGGSDRTAARRAPTVRARSSSRAARRVSAAFARGQDVQRRAPGGPPPRGRGGPATPGVCAPLDIRARGTDGRRATGHAHERRKAIGHRLIVVRRGASGKSPVRRAEQPVSTAPATPRVPAAPGRPSVRRTTSITSSTYSSASPRSAAVRTQPRTWSSRTRIETRVDGGPQGGGLLEDVDAVLLALDHPGDAPDLALDPAEPADQRALVLASSCDGNRRGASAAWVGRLARGLVAMAVGPSVADASRPSPRMILPGSIGELGRGIPDRGPAGRSTGPIGGRLDCASMDLRDRPPARPAAGAPRVSDPRPAQTGPDAAAELDEPTEASPAFAHASEAELVPDPRLLCGPLGVRAARLPDPVEHRRRRSSRASPRTSTCLTSTSTSR